MCSWLPGIQGFDCKFTWGLYLEKRRERGKLEKLNCKQISFILCIWKANGENDCTDQSYFFMVYSPYYAFKCHKMIKTPFIHEKYHPGIIICGKTFLSSLIIQHGRWLAGWVIFALLRLLPCMSFSPSRQKSSRHPFSSANHSTITIFTPFCAVFAQLTVSDKGVFVSVTVVKIIMFYFILYVARKSKWWKL